MDQCESVVEEEYLGFSCAKNREVCCEEDNWRDPEDKHSESVIKGRHTLVEAAFFLIYAPKRHKGYMNNYHRLD